MAAEPPSVDLVAHCHADVATCFLTQRLLWQQVGEGQRGATLYVYALRQECLSLGRFHVAPRGSMKRLHRRFAGGRVLPLGPGRVCLALMLPRRDAMTGAEPDSLSAPQVMNRHVRGFLRACRAAGVEPMYPGRDVVTVDRKLVATLGLECDERGAAIFEMAIAGSDPFGGLEDLLHAADPSRVLTADLPGGGEVSDIEREIGRPLPFEELLALLAQGFAAQLGAPIRSVELTPPEREAVERGRGGNRAVAEWLGGRRLTESINRRGSHLGRGGAFDVYFEERDGRLGDVLFSGAFIAPSATVAKMESALRGCRLEASAIDRRIADACSHPGAYLLGVEPVTALRDAILRGTGL
jgi:lipoate-protein ligase A